MDGPERLDVERPPLRRRTGWLVLGVALVVVGGLAVVRVSGVASDPAPGPTSSSSRAASVGPVPSSSAAAATAWPVAGALPSGTLYVLGSDDVYSIDASSGFTQPLGVSPDESTSLTPMEAGVLLWSPDGPKEIVYYTGAHPQRLRGPGRSARAVLPSADQGYVWTDRQARGLPGATWVEADEDRPTGPRVRVRGFAVPDGAGGLFDAEESGVHHVYPGPRRDLGGGYVLAVGPDGYVISSCANRVCTPELHERSGVDADAGAGATGGTAIGPAAPVDPERLSAVVDPGALSPHNRFLARTVPSRDMSSDEVEVSRVGPTTQVLRTFPGGRAGTAFAWLSDRWLVTVSEEQLVLYDAVAGTVLTPEAPFRARAQLAWLPS